MNVLYFLIPLLFLVGCSKPASNERKIKLYQSPMHPWITSNEPGNCTICGMQLVPVYEGQEVSGTGNVITLNQNSVNVLNVATVPVRRMELTKSLRFSGILEDDENIHRVIAAFYDGRIDQVYVEHVGEYVTKGTPLAAIYSPELLYIVREYQNAMRGGNQAVARNSAQRLVQYGLGAGQVAALAKLPDTIYTIELQAPISGTIVTKKAYKGQYIKTGEPLFEMGDLSRLWFHAEVYERDLPNIRMGQKAVLRTPTVPGRDFEGVVTFIDPNFDPQTRSTKVRVEVDNPSVEGGDPHGMRRMLAHRSYAEADIRADLGEALVVPRAAILQDGRRSVAYVETAAGGYEPRMVQTGRIGDEGIEILAGLKDGEKVVTQGNLMIDAEAQLRHIAVVEEKPSSTVAPLPPQQPVVAFLEQLAEVSDALASDDIVAAVKAGQALPALVAAIPLSGNPAIDSFVAHLKALPTGPLGSDLKALRQSFLPWSMDGASLDIAMAQGGQKTALLVFECPMTGDSFPGAPSQARWVQKGEEVRNPYLGLEMLNCGGLVTP